MNSQPDQKVDRKERLLVLDAARFFAALAVVIYHYKTNYLQYAHISTESADLIYAITKFGYLGVDLFFMISGFVILASALNRNAVGFAISRMTRIYPTFWVCMTITALVLWLTPQQLFPISLKQYLANLTLFEGYLGIEHMDGVYWTLEVEIKFYFLMFALVLFGLLKYHRWWLPVWLLMCVTFLMFGQPFFLGWFISPEYSSYFIAGIIFYLGYMNQKFEVSEIVILAGAAILSCVYGYRLIDTFASNITQSDRLIAVAIVLAIYGFFYLIATRKVSLSNMSWLMILGGITYPLYLLHSAIGKADFELYGSKAYPFLSLLIITGGVILVSLLLHLFVERRVADKLKQLLLATASRLPLINRF